MDWARIANTFPHFRSLLFVGYVICDCNLSNSFVNALDFGIVRHLVETNSSTAVRTSFFHEQLKQLNPGENSFVLITGQYNWLKHRQFFFRYRITSSHSTWTLFHSSSLTHENRIFQRYFDKWSSHFEWDALPNIRIPVSCDCWKQTENLLRWTLLFSARIVFWALLLYSFWSFIYLTGNMPVCLFVFLSCSSCASQRRRWRRRAYAYYVDVQRAAAIVCEMSFVSTLFMRRLPLFFLQHSSQFSITQHTLITNCTVISLVVAV